MIEVNSRDRAVFEAGIKLGALYHQFVGTPINTDTLDGLARIIEESIGLQPFVKSIKVSIDLEMVKKKQNPEFGYCELEGRMLHVNLQVHHKDIIVNAEMCYDEEKDYPLMIIKNIQEM